MSTTYALLAHLVAEAEPVTGESHGATRSAARRRVAQWPRSERRPRSRRQGKSSPGLSAEMARTVDCRGEPEAPQLDCRRGALGPSSGGSRSGRAPVSPRAPGVPGAGAPGFGGVEEPWGTAREPGGPLFDAA